MNSEQAADKGYIELLISDGAGIYIPQEFCENFEGWEGIDADSRTSCLNGPDDEFYWESWDEVLQTAKYVDESGKEWGLMQDGDLWAVRSDIEIEWE